MLHPKIVFPQKRYIFKKYNSKHDDEKIPFLIGMTHIEISVDGRIVDTEKMTRHSLLSCDGWKVESVRIFDYILVFSYFVLLS